MTAGSSRQFGVTLVELMVAMVIGLVLLLGLLQLFSASRAAYSTAEGLGRVQENARFAMEFLQRDIRMAGHFGCVNDQAHWVKGEGDPAHHFGSVVTGGGSALDFSVSVEGYEAPGTGPGDDPLTLGEVWSPPSGITGLSPAPVGGSDIIVLRYLSPEGVPVSALGASTVAFDSSLAPRLTTDGVSAPSLFGIADCTRADVFPATFTSAAVDTGTALGLDARYSPQPSGQTMLYRANSIVFYVGLNGASEPALYRARAGSSGAYVSEELVEGIESLQLLYGQDSRPVLGPTTPPIGNITRLGSAADVRAGAGADVANAWRRVGLVQVGLLARSPMPASAPGAEGAIRVLGTRFEPSGSGDGRYRASYESTIAIRNRLFGN